MKIAIIGAGPSGLVAAKEILVANPHAEICVFEETNRLGGTFAHAYDGFTMVNNPLLVAFSDFLPQHDMIPSHLRMWSAQEYVAYLTEYARKYGIGELVRFNSRVIECVPNANGWSVMIQSMGAPSEYSCNYIVICAGSNYEPKMPELSGQDGFPGEIIHSSHVKTFDQFAGKRVLLIGLGETGSDFSNLLSETAAQVSVSVRRAPGYVIARYLGNKPSDLNTSRVYHGLPYTLNETKLGRLIGLKRRMEARSIRNPIGRSVQALIDEINEKYAPSQRLGPFRRASTKSCGIAWAILKGRTSIKPGISRLAEKRVIFADGSQGEVDVIIACTGYRQTFPFLPESLRHAFDSSANFYRYMFPVGWGNRLAFIGYVRPAVGTVPVIAEMQSRMLALVLQGSLMLPEAATMRRSIEKQIMQSKNEFPYDADQIPHLIDYYSYLKKIASEIGAMPQSLRFLANDPRLWFKINFSFLCPAIFRLHGPGNRHAEAAEIIRRLPTMPLRVLAIEGLVYAACAMMSALGIRRYQLK